MPVYHKKQVVKKYIFICLNSTVRTAEVTVTVRLDFVEVPLLWLHTIDKVFC